MPPAPKSSVVDNVIELLHGSSLVNKIREEKNAAKTLHRRTLIGELRRIERAREKERPVLEQKVEQATAGIHAAEKQMRMAEKLWNAAATARETAAAQYVSRHDKLEDELRLEVRPLIQEFVSWCLTELDVTLKATASSDEHQHNEITGLTVTTTRNNCASVIARHTAIRAAMAKAEELAVELDDLSTLPAKLQALRDSLPAIDSELTPYRISRGQ